MVWYAKRYRNRVEDVDEEQASGSRLFRNWHTPLESSESRSAESLMF